MTVTVILLHDLNHCPNPQPRRPRVGSAPEPKEAELMRYVQPHAYLGDGAPLCAFSVHRSLYLSRSLPSQTVSDSDRDRPTPKQSRSSTKSFKERLGSADATPSQKSKCKRH